MGPVLLLPTGSNDLLTADKWGAGPTAVALKHEGRVTYGVLGGNHIWSFAGDAKRSDISSTFIQPFATYGWPGGWSATVTADSTYDWKGEQWTIPLGVFVNKVTGSAVRSCKWAWARAITQKAGRQARTTGDSAQSSCCCSQGNAVVAR